AQDLILQIDGEDTTGISLEAAVNKIRGEKGTTVVLTVLHKDETETEEISIVRDAIHVDNVRTEIRNFNGKNIAVIELIMFGPGLRQEFNSALQQATNGGAQGIILDLRNNPGGLLDAAIDIASFWLPRGKVVLKEVDADKKEFVYESEGPGQLEGVP